MDRETGNTKIEWILQRQKLEEMGVEDHRETRKKEFQKRKVV